MKRLRRLGLTERLLAILLAVAGIDFLANTFLFDSATTSALRKEDSARIGDHLVVAVRAVAREAPENRAALARALTTPRFSLAWSPPASADERLAAPDSGASRLRDQIVQSSPDLSREGRRMMVQQRGSDSGQDTAITGAVTLPGGDRLTFRTYAGDVRMQLSVWQIVPMLLPTLLLGGLAWMMFRATIRSLRTLVKALRHIEAANPRNLPERGPDEVRRLIRAFNQMQRRIQRSQSERTQSMLAIGHDLRTPLARLQLRLDNAPLEQEARAEMESDIAEMLHLLESLQAFVDTGAPQIPAQRIDIAIMAATLVDSAADQGADATYNGPESLEIMARAVSIRRSLANLIDNALHHAGQVRVHLADLGEAIEIRIEDNGPGIPEDRMEDVFQPFFRLDSARARDTPGMGLGLSIVAAAIRLEAGTLALRNRAEGGLAAIIRLPQATG
ncbi:MAG: ATP-binding protein [Novosphingobium sp.]